MPKPVANTIREITLVYDPECPLCVRCRHWIEAQPALVNIKFLKTTSKQAAIAYGQVPWIGEEIVIIADTGEVWAGTAAFIVALWALRDWRAWSYRLSGTMLTPLVERFFM